MTVWRRLRRSLRFAALAFLFWPLQALPRPLGRGLGAFWGTIAFWFLPKLRRRSGENLARAFPDWPREKRRRVAREVFRWVGRTGSDFLRLGGSGRARLLSQIEVEGMEYWREAVALGRGVVLVTGHVGNWELMAAWISALGWKLHVLYHPFSEERLERLVRKRREACGVEGIAVGRTGVAALRVLFRGEVLGVLLDRRPRGPGVGCRFFGRECLVAPGAAYFAVVTGAPIVPAALLEVGGGRYRLKFRRAIHPEEAEGGRTEVIGRLTRRATAELEGLIREAPEQWPWFFDRWRMRSRPLEEGELDPRARPPGRDRSGRVLPPLRPPGGQTPPAGATAGDPGPPAPSDQPQGVALGPGREAGDFVRARRAGSAGGHDRALL